MHDIINVFLKIKPDKISFGNQVRWNHKPSVIIHIFSCVCDSQISDVVTYSHQTSQGCTVPVQIAQPDLMAVDKGRFPA